MESRTSSYVLAQVEVAAAEANVPMRQRANLKVIIGDTYLPGYLSDGKLYVQAPLGLIWKALTTAVSQNITNMEVRISGARGAALPLDGAGSSLPR